MTEDIKTDEPGILKLTLALGTITGIAGIVLGFVAYFTMPIAAANAKKHEIELRKAILSEAKTFDEIEGFDNWYIGKSESGESIGYVVLASEKGYGGSIVLTLGIDNEFKVTNYLVLRHNETPGLGDGAKKKKFKNQFKGKKSSELVLTKTMEKNRIQAITGATITSKAVLNAIKNALESLEKSQKKARQE